VSLVVEPHPGQPATSKPVFGVEAAKIFRRQARVCPLLTRELPDLLGALQERDPKLTRDDVVGDHQALWPFAGVQGTTRKVLSAEAARGISHKARMLSRS